MALLCREFNLSEAHPSKSRQAAVERRQQQLGQEPSFQQRTSYPQGRSQSAGPQRPQGEQRLEQLSRPKTAHWEKCEYMCLAHQWSGMPIGPCFSTCVRGAHGQAYASNALVFIVVIRFVVRPCTGNGWSGMHVALGACCNVHA